MQLVMRLFGKVLARDLSNPLSLSSTYTYFKYVCLSSTTETEGQVQANNELRISHEAKSSLPLLMPYARIYASSFPVKPT